LLDAFRAGRMPQAVLLGGREGIGKATLAWRLARFLLANPDPGLPTVQKAIDLSVSPDNPAARRMAAQSHADVVGLRREWEPKGKKHYTEIRIDDVRKAIDLFRRAPSEGGWRIVIVDCADDLNRSSANALLKTIEEPPPRSLFVIVAHKPARIMPTIRSRCRKITLSPLSPQECSGAIAALGPPFADHARDEIEGAAARADGSVRDALRLLAGGGLKLADDIDRLLGGLPKVDWRGVHRLATAAQGRTGEEAFETLLAAVFEWIDARVRAAASAGANPRSLAPFAHVWEKIAASARETQALNLDRRPLVLSIFSDLSDAVAASRT
jgi:DNA polymerase-3 subunit delta'